MGIGDRVTVSGTMPRAEYLVRSAASRISISCSTLEAFGFPVAEALLMGAPVLCGDIPAHVELVRRARAGALFPARNPRALASRPIETLSGARTPDRMTTVPEDWSWRSRAAQHLATYVALLGANAQRVDATAEFAAA
ncbi:MAG: glycosyltransferase [Gemmatimonadaceae bacterium]